MKRLRWSMAVAVSAGIMVGLGGNIHAAEKTVSIEVVNADLEEGLGLTLEQKEKLKLVREAFKARQQEIRRALNIKNEALRQGLDADDPARAKVDAVAAEIKLLQGLLESSRTTPSWATPISLSRL